MDQDFSLVLIGNDVNAYYMARNYYEEYGKKPYVVGRIPMLFTSTSQIMNLKIVEDLNQNDIFLETVISLAKEINKEKIILVGCNDDYVSLIIKNKDILKEYYLFNYMEEDLLNKIVNKENFYKSFKGMGLDFPETYFCTPEDDYSFLDKFMFPIIIKPSNVVKYHVIDGLDKVYRFDDKEKTIETIKKIRDLGYDDDLIVQEFIPGDDSRLFDSVFYVSSKKKPWLQSFGQIGLQEHTKTGIGNLTVLINGYNEFNNTEIIQNKLKQFLEDIGFNGICEFDMKYDERDGKFKIFEINPRQARSSYYLTKCGYNLVKYLVDDLIYDKDYEFKFIHEEVALSFVPDVVVKKYINNNEYKKKFFELKKKKQFTSPLYFKKDMSFNRRKFLFMREINYIIKYKNGEWK